MTQPAYHQLHSLESKFRHGFYERAACFHAYAFQFFNLQLLEIVEKHFCGSTVMFNCRVGQVALIQMLYVSFMYLVELATKHNLVL